MYFVSLSWSFLFSLVFSYLWVYVVFFCFFFFFKQNTAYEMRISDWSSDVCSSDLRLIASHTLWNTKRFLQLLSADVPPTDAYVSEQESICFDWDENCQCQLSVMVQHGGRIAFAAYFNGDRLNGAANFTGAELPAELGAAITRWQRGGKAR